jgi:hypothetical protein
MPPGSSSPASGRARPRASCSRSSRTRPARSRSSLFERERRTVLGAGLMGVTGEVQREGEVVHLIARKLEDRTALLGGSGRCHGISVSPKASLPRTVRVRS